MFTKTITALALATGLATAAMAAPTPTLFDGHYYSYVNASLSWADAKAAAEASSYNGLQGYLATITSDAENNFLTAMSSDGWLGGSDAAVEGEWRWAGGPEAGQLFYSGQCCTGTTITYAHWNSGEPNNQGNEDYLHINGGRWNDLPASSRLGYFVEYGGTASVPEAATWMTMLTGFGALGIAMRRRRALATA